MPPEMTKEINKDLEHKFDDNHPNFRLQDICSAIQIHLAREKTASETIMINALSTQVEAMAINRTPTSRRSFNPSAPYPSRSTPQHFNKIDPMRWKRGHNSLTKDDDKRQHSTITPISIPMSSVKAVKDGLIQCFFCGEFGHTYSDPTGPCMKYNRNSDRTGGRQQQTNSIVLMHFSLPSIQSLTPHAPPVHNIVQWLMQ